MQKRHVVLNGDLAMDAYVKGKTDAEIARICSVRVETARAWRKRMGLDPNTKPKRRELTPLERDAIEARKRGMTYGQYKADQMLGTAYGQYRLGHKFGGRNV